MVLTPPKRDKMPGRYWAFWWLSPGRQKSAGRRRVEQRIARRYASTVMLEEAAARAAGDDPSDCIHGCNGMCIAFGSDRCNFTCHPELPNDYWSNR